jgi:hypothetical protein
MDVIRELCSFENRLAGSDAERRAANRLATRLRDGGRRAEVEPIYVHPRYGLVHAAHCALGFAGSLLAIVQPAIGFAIVLATAVSMYLDLNYRVYLVRRLFFRRASQNVVSPGELPDAPARVPVRPLRRGANRRRSIRSESRGSAARRHLSLPRAVSDPVLVARDSAAILGARMAGIDSRPASPCCSSSPP